MTPRAAIVGISGTTLTAEEAALFRRERPVGAILFARNVADPVQLATLNASIRDILGADAPILVDQEGGRVARLRPPHWAAHPPANVFEGRPEAAAEANAALLGMACAAAGFDVVCAPVLDLRLPGAHDVIGDRAFSDDPVEVARLGAAWVRGLQVAGCVPVIKHIPGHGRATVDSHESLPRVGCDRAMLEADIAAFRPLAGCDAWAMTAHILYDCLDPKRPATLSRIVIEEVIRRDIGFDGVIVSDDLAMGAVAGTSNRLAEEAIEAGCDLVLHCTGRLDETAAVLSSCPRVSDASAARMAAAKRAVQRARRPLDSSALLAMRDGALASAA
ncbi:MAG TPA: beta-N-acetylhexosaminidase [Acetobacteraceae bacterium]|nr:beta-N-acetylhexosaminidase [Acetobacteraceae bacterium]